MPIILDWKELAKQRKEKLKQEFTKPFWQNKFLAIFFLWDNVSSETYVRMKKKFWKTVWIDVRVYWQDNEFQTHTDIITQINFLNNDSNCIWIMVQLPIPASFDQYQADILSSILPTKDVDWLGGNLLWLGMLWFTDVLPATPSGCFTLLAEYWYSDFTWKTCSVIWQSNLIGKPLCTQLMKLGATVFSFNHHSDQQLMKECSLRSDFIFSCTWQIFLVDDSFIRKDNTQVVIDIWRGKRDGKAVWDANFGQIAPFLKAYTPVPGWVWPMTILSIFENIIKLWNK